MNELQWQKNVTDWQQRFHIKIRPPLDRDVVSRELSRLRGGLDDLKDLYSACNGFALEGVGVLPIYDPKSPKKTWDSLQRANASDSSKYLGADASLLARFLVFGSLQGGGGIAWDRDSQRIWYESDGELHETLWGLRDFLDAALREVSSQPKGSE